MYATKNKKIWRHHKSRHDPNKKCSNLWDVIQQSFVKSLYCVGVHLHAVCDELDEVRNGVVSHVAPCLEGWAETSMRNANELYLPVDLQ